MHAIRWCQQQEQITARETVRRGVIKYPSGRTAPFIAVMYVASIIPELKTALEIFSSTSIGLVREGTTCNMQHTAKYDWKKKM